MSGPIRRGEPLAREQEAKYVVEAKGGDIAARHTLIEDNLWLVTRAIGSLVPEYPEQWITIHLDDLIAAGVIGLIKAVHAFNPDTGKDLAEVAFPFIQDEIKNRLNNRALLLSDPEGREAAYWSTMTLRDVLAVSEPTQDIEISPELRKQIKERAKEKLSLRYDWKIGRSNLPKRLRSGKAYLTRRLSALGLRRRSDGRRSIENDSWIPGLRRGHQHFQVPPLTP